PLAAAAAATSTTGTGAAAPAPSSSTAMAMAMVATPSVAAGGVSVAPSSAGTQPILPPPPPPAAVARQQQQQHMLPRIATLDSAKTGYFDASWGAMATEWEEQEAAGAPAGAP
ncbi:unnamed protein product, partial [Ectocarpus fasciculatus]